MTVIGFILLNSSRQNTYSSGIVLITLTDKRIPGTDKNSDSELYMFIYKTV